MRRSSGASKVVWGILMASITIWGSLSWAEESTPVAPPVPEPTCVKEGTGNTVGSLLADFEMTNCNGEVLTLQSRCGKVKALWVMYGTGWCPGCGEYVPVMADQYTKFKDKGLDIIVFLGEDNNGNPVTPAYCKKYAKSHKVDASMVYIMTWKAVNTTFNTCKAGYIPWAAILDGRDMKYIYSNQCESATFADETAAIQSLIPDYL
jgi:hypothetical protein